MSLNNNIITIIYLIYYINIGAIHRITAKKGNTLIYR